MVKRRFFGPVRALINDQEKRVTLGFGPRRGSRLQQLSDSVRETCMIWALDTLRAELGDYVIVSDESK